MGYFLFEITLNGTMHRISMEGVTLTNNWRNRVISFDAPLRSITRHHGGYCRIGFGSIYLSHDLFEDDWPPPINAAFVAKYTATTEALAETLFPGTAHLAKIDRNGVAYDLYGEEFDVDLLDTSIDYNGDTVPVPRAFGTITQEQPVRLPDVGGNETYHHGYLEGSLGSHWYVYDDGVDDSGNVTDNGDGTFAFTGGAPAGEVTVSGTTSEDDINAICNWACGASYLNLTYDNMFAEDPSPTINHWATSQMPILDFLDFICGFRTHLFYISGTTFHLVDMDLNNGMRTIDEFDFFPSAYTWNPPVATIRSIWATRDAVAEGIGAYVKTFIHETAVVSSYPYGSEEQITPYHTTISEVESSLQDILEIIHAPRMQVRLPLAGTLPAPGEKISLTDTSLGQDVDMWIRVRVITLDFVKEESIIEGEGEITA